MTRSQQRFTLAHRIVTRICSAFSEETVPKFGALNQEVTGSHTEAEWLALLNQWNWLCFYCGESVRRNSPDPKREATKDHMTPISRGGVDFIGNIVPACLRCNDLKGNKTVEEFRSERAWVLKRNQQGLLGKDRDQRDPQPNNGVSLLPSVEIAAMWKRVVDDVSAKKQMQDTRTDDWWKQRRAVLKKQAEGMRRMSLETAGQLVLPIFGDGTPRKLMETEPESLAVSKGMHIVERQA